MSRENVQVVRRVYAFEADAAGIVRGDYDAVLGYYFDPDCELLPPRAYPDIEPSYRGVEGLRRWFAQMDDIWNDFHMEPERYFDAGARVVVFARVSGAAKGSGARIAISSAHLLTLRDGRITRTEIYLDRSEALEAAGLRE